MNDLSQTQLPVIEDGSISRSLPSGETFTPPRPGHFKNRYTNSEWSKALSAILNGGHVADEQAAARRKLQNACTSMPTAKARRVMWLSLGLDGHGWLNEVFSGISSNFSRELSSLLHGPLTQTPENLTLAYARSIPPGITLVRHEVALLCDQRLYDGTLTADQLVERLRCSTNGIGRLVIMFGSYALVLTEEERDRQAPASQSPH